jgi:hypothetical protein
VQGFAPAIAIKYLVRLVHSVTAVASLTQDAAWLDQLPDLAPLAPLSPAFAIAAQNVTTARCMIAGQHFAAIAGYEGMIARLSEPDRAGHEPTLHRYVRLAFVYACAHNLAGLGRKAALELAAELEGDPLHKLNALRVRAGYSLTLGDAARAESYLQKVELLEIQNAPAQFFEGHDALRYLPAYAALDDLANVKRMLDVIDRLAERFPGWVAARDYAEGEYARIRGDHPYALQCFARALERTQAGHHQVWPRAAEQYLSVLVTLGRASEAVVLGREWAQTWERYDLVAAVGVAQAAAEAAIGEHASALQRVEAIIERWTKRGMTGVQLGRACELAALIARNLRDEARYEAYEARCRETYALAASPALLSRQRRLFAQ